jgi:hypothetical protein
MRIEAAKTDWREKIGLEKEKIPRNQTLSTTIKSGS